MELWQALFGKLRFNAEREENMKNTNLEMIKIMAKSFLRLDIAETRVPFVASHPFTSSWIVGLPDGSVVDLHDVETARKWREDVGNLIDKSTLYEIFMMMNTPYILNFLKFVANDMSDEDLGMILGDFWQNIEYISVDNSVTSKQLMALFKRANKNTLMNEDERELFASLPEEVTVYRGVTSYNKRKKKAFSWTTDKGIARWFANRFDTGTGEIWTAVVPKERILCVFNGREKEVIVDMCGYKAQITVEKA